MLLVSRLREELLLKGEHLDLVKWLAGINTHLQLGGLGGLHNPSPIR